MSEKGHSCACFRLAPWLNRQKMCYPRFFFSNNNASSMLDEIPEFYFENYTAALENTQYHWRVFKNLNLQ